MTIKVLVVDDSTFFTNRLCELINTDPELEVIDTASDGAEAIEKVKKLNPDVITMDVNMPVMDGITAVRKIMEIIPTPVLMLSALTKEGASATLEALEAGAVDFLPKRAEEISSEAASGGNLIQAKIKEIVKSRPRTKEGKRLRRESEKKNYKVVIIGTSTGGPVALHSILKELPGDFPLPIVMVQHMPEAFTGPFAERLNNVCEISVKEAEDNDVLKPGTALLARGGYQLLFENNGAGVVVKVVEGDTKLQYHPSVDLTFSSAADVFAKSALAIVLTGMGSDGTEGAKKLKEKGSVIWAQDKESSVVFGMPMSIISAGLADEVVSLNGLPNQLVNEIG